MCYANRNGREFNLIHDVYSEQHNGTNKVSALVLCAYMLLMIYILFIRMSDGRRDMRMQDIKESFTLDGI